MESLPDELVIRRKFKTGYADWEHWQLRPAQNPAVPGVPCRLLRVQPLTRFTAPTTCSSSMWIIEGKLSSSSASSLYSSCVIRSPVPLCEINPIDTINTTYLRRA